MTQPDDDARSTSPIGRRCPRRRPAAAALSARSPRGTASPTRSSSRCGPASRVLAAVEDGARSRCRRGGRAVDRVPRGRPTRSARLSARPTAILDGFLTKQRTPSIVYGDATPRRRALDRARRWPAAVHRHAPRSTQESAAERAALSAAATFARRGPVALRRHRPPLARRRFPARRSAARTESPPRVGPRPRPISSGSAIYVRPPSSRGSARGGRLGFLGLSFKRPTRRYRPGREAPTTGRIPHAPPLMPSASSHHAPSARGWYGRAPCPRRALTPAIRDEIARLGQADIMVGIPSFKNAATIGYVVRAAQAGLVQYFPDLRPVLVNSDAGSPDGTQRVVIDTEPPDYVEQILLVRPTNKLDAGHADLPRDRRRRRQGRRPADDLRDRGGPRGPGARRRRLGPALDRARMDRAPRRPDPQGRLRLRRAALRALQVRRHDHQHRHLPADAGPLRAPHPPADRRRLRRLAATSSGTTSSSTTGPTTSASSASTSG